MFKNEETSLYIEDYKTLHHDIGLFQRSNGQWDLWFGQDEISENYKNSPYLNINKGDIVSATEVHSLQVGIIIACLTSWNYLNRTENPIYTEFGNEAYSLLKTNKSENTRYKIKQFFIDCLNRMRRVYSVESLDVLDVADNPYLYRVTFKVVSVTNTLVDGEFYLNTDSNKNVSVLDVTYNHLYTSASNPLVIECVLQNEYGSSINGELIYIYLKNGDNSDFKFYGVSEPTDNRGISYVTVPPKGLNGDTQVMLIFKGNSLYNSCVSKIINIQSVSYYFKSRYTYKTVVENGVEVKVVDKEILYIEDSLGNSIEKFRLGELLSDYLDIDNMYLYDYISIEEIVDYSTDNHLLEYVDGEWVFDDNELGKLYLIPTNEQIIGTDKVYYKAYSWDKHSKRLILNDEYKIQLNTANPDEVHFLINDEDNGLFEINFEDNHLYYYID